MLVGFSKICVNPTLGAPLEGLGQIVGCTEIHDDLYLNGLCLRDDTTLEYVDFHTHWILPWQAGNLQETARRVHRVSKT